jgi:hypothetical protein
MIVLKTGKTEIIDDGDDPIFPLHDKKEEIG